MNIEEAKNILAEVAEEVKLQHFIWVNTGEIEIKVHTESLPIELVLRIAFSDGYKRSVKKLSCDSEYTLCVLSVDTEDYLALAPSVAVVDTIRSQIFRGEVLFFKKCDRTHVTGFTYSELGKVLGKLAVFGATIPIQYEVSECAEKALLSHSKAVSVVSWANSTLNNN